MQTAEEFMQSYLRDKAEMQQFQHEKIKEFHRKYFGESYIKYLSDWQDAKKHNPEIFVSIELSRLSAKAITSEPLGNTQQRYCYDLVVSGQGWKIERKTWECFACRGIGRGDRNICNVCNGKGWTDPRKDTN
jgi:DnaJ-class molecular chaperone